MDTHEIAFKRLGGTVKLAKVLAILPHTSWEQIEKFLAENVPKHLQDTPPGSFTLGLSLYNFSMGLSDINRSLMKLKKVLKKSGRSIRVVPNKSAELTSAQVLHNKLTHKGAWELLLVRDNGRTILAQTMFVQDIAAYGARDQARPKRDARVGMLPPKLAQTMVNIAAGPAASGTVLDPFCGTGVILQEALLMGYKVIGSDAEKRMADYSRYNLEWLQQSFPHLDGQYRLETADATRHSWRGFDFVASETYLGRPFSRYPDEAVLKQVISDVNTIIKKFLKNLAPQIETGTRLCLAVPAWRKSEGLLVSLPVIDQIADLGYNYLDLRHAARSEMVYFREGQTVARQLLALSKA